MGARSIIPDPPRVVVIACLGYSRAGAGAADLHGRLDAELDKLQRVPLLIVDEVGYIPFDPHAANLMFMLVSRRYERASMIVTSSKPFSGWGEIFGDEVTAPR